MLASLVLVYCAAVLRERLQVRQQWLVALATLVVVSGTAALARLGTQHREAFVDRRAEVELGALAREYAGSGRLLIGTRDYGFFAVIAGFGDPTRAEPIDRRDPRSQRAADPFAGEQALRARSAREAASVLIAPTEHAELATRLGTTRAELGGYVLVQLK
jgi:hypothetical protein